MASPVDESTDSRTQRVGRKRALQDSSQQSREVISLLDSSGDESAPAPKRPRQESAIPSGTTSLNGEIDLTASLGQASNAQSLSALESFTNGPLPTWNKGVQGGLRTSFGSKNRVPTVLEPTQRPPPVIQTENNGHASSGKHIPPISSLTERSREHQDMNEEMLDTIGGTEDTQQSNTTSRSLPNQQGKSVSFAPEPKKEPRTRSRKRQDDLQQALPARAKDDVKTEKDKPPPEKKKKKTLRDDKLQLATNTADQAMDRFGWPLPKELENIKTAISKGKTFYPCSSGGGDQRYVYQFDNFKFVLTEVLNEEGKPIRLQDITLPIFAQSFLEVNMDVVDTDKDGKLNEKRLSAAFNSYISRFYSHCMKFFDSDAKGTIKSVPDMVKKVKDSIEANPIRPKKRAVAQAPLLVRSDDYYKLDEADPILPKSDTSDVDDIGMDDVDEADRANDEQELGEVDEMDVAEMEEVVDEVENAVLQKYFPPTPANYPRQRCITCASTRHTTKHCLELICGSCGARGVHVTSACPQTIRCLKCFGRGHKTDECPEKLRAVQTEVRACDICTSTAHAETECHHIWRTHIRDETKKVRNIRVDCYSCGAEGHYGPECGLHQGKLLSGGLTWSRSNLHLYLDSSSQDRAISAGIDYSIPNRAPKGFSIKGKATDPILLDGNNSDEEDSFLRPKVPRGPKHGAIIMGQTQNQDRSYQNNPQSSSGRPSLDDSIRYGHESTGDFGGSANGSAATTRKRGHKGGEGGRGGANRGKSRKRNDRARTVSQLSTRRR
jgi:protein AIR1/2